MGRYDPSYPLEIRAYLSPNETIPRSNETLLGRADVLTGHASLSSRMDRIIVTMASKQFT